MGWVVNITPRPPYPPHPQVKRPDTNFTGGWVGPRGGLEGLELYVSLCQPCVANHCCFTQVCAKHRNVLPHRFFFWTLSNVANFYNQPGQAQTVFISPPTSASSLVSCSQIFCSVSVGNRAVSCVCARVCVTETRLCGSQVGLNCEILRVQLTVSRRVRNFTRHTRQGTVASYCEVR